MCTVFFFFKPQTSQITCKTKKLPSEPPSMLTTLRTTDGSRRRLMRTGNAYCQAIYKGIEGEEWDALYYHYRELNQATGAKKPGESPKAKALWSMKAARDRDGKYYDPARKKRYSGQNKNSSGIVGRTSQRSGGGIGKGVGMPGSQIVGRAFCLRNGVQHRWCEKCAKDVGRVSGLFSRTHGMLWVCAQQPASGMFRGSTGRTASSFFFLIKEPFGLTKAVECRLFVPAETLWACALIGLHLMAAECIRVEW